MNFPLRHSNEPQRQRRVTSGPQGQRAKSVLSTSSPGSVSRGSTTSGRTRTDLKDLVNKIIADSLASGEPKHIIDAQVVYLWRPSRPIALPRYFKPILRRRKLEKEYYAKHPNLSPPTSGLEFDRERAWGRYAASWKRVLTSQRPITWKTFPWPITLQLEGNLEENLIQRKIDYFFAYGTPTPDPDASGVQVLEDALNMYHPHNIAPLLGRVEDDGERNIIKKGAERVWRQIPELLEHAVYMANLAAKHAAKSANKVSQ